MLIKTVATLFAFMFLSQSCAANTSQAQNFSIKQLDRAMQRFVQQPHPMGSDEQKKLARDIKSQLIHDGWETEFQQFKTAVPNLSSVLFGGKFKAVSSTKIVDAENIIAVSKGSDRCMMIIGGHYDTKFFQDFRFVGANDGGSSTAFMQELARVITTIRKQESHNKINNKGRFLDCSIALVFFDGEEAVLKEWSDGDRTIGLKDNTYGSREFIKKLEKKFEGYTFLNLPIKAAIIVDMIGHRNQNLFITEGSHASLTQQFLSKKTNTKIMAANISIEDDHQPFAQLGIPYLHIIDWTNLSEWHTPKDTLDIVSTKKIAEFGEHFVRFLNMPR